jgi:peroxiredoxin
MVKCVVVLTVSLLIAASLHADGAYDLLISVAEKYDSLSNFVLEGIETAALSPDCNVEIPFQIARPGPLTSSAGIPATSLPLTIRFTHAKGPISKPCFDVVKKLGGFRSPGEWTEFNRIDVGVTDVHELPPQILKLYSGAIHCTVLEVVYDDYYQRIRAFTGPIRYWIDAATHLVRRVEFTEVAEPGARSWTATLEKISIGGPIPPWLGPADIPDEHTKLIGKLAPDFALRTPEGQVVRLVDLRGKMVLLDFWATWCFACDEEIPTLEKLQSEVNMSEVIVLGISDESATVVRKWLEENHRSFRTLVDANKTFRRFGIKPIPALVVIDRNGVVTDYITGFDSDRHMCEFVKHLTLN